MTTDAHGGPGSGPGLRFRPAVSADTTAVRDLVFGVLREYGFTPDPKGTDADLDDLELSYGRRGGAFELLVDQEGRLLGCVGLYPQGGTTAELRKLYLRPEARGQGLGRRLLAHALDVARGQGFEVVELQTASTLDRAVAMYRRAGFEAFEPAVRVPRSDIALRLRLSGPPTAELLRRFYAAFARRDHVTMAGCYAPGATFSDPVFTGLRGAEVAGMWRMLCERGTDLRIEYRDIHATAEAGSAHWEAWYSYGRARRSVHNSVDASFRFEQGLIVSHVDSFSLTRWARQALGPTGVLLGWARPFQEAIRSQARQSLHRYLARNA